MIIGILLCKYFGGIEDLDIHSTASSENYFVMKVR